MDRDRKHTDRKGQRKRVNKDLRKPRKKLNKELLSLMLLNLADA